MDRILHKFLPDIKSLPIIERIGTILFIIPDTPGQLEAIKASSATDDSVLNWAKLIKANEAEALDPIPGRKAYEFNTIRIDERRAVNAPRIYRRN